MNRNGITTFKFLWPLLGILFLCLLPARPAHAQQNVVGYRCDQARDWIVITYGAPATGFNAENFTGPQAIQKTCALRNGTYEVDISASAEPGVQDMCADAGNVKIFPNSKYIRSPEWQYATSIGGDCVVGTGASVSQIIYNDRTGELITSSTSG
jgi:hypothetical protein